MFLASKLFQLVAAPGTLLIVFMVIATGGLYSRWRAGARRLLVCALSLFVLLSLGPVGDLLLRPLENRFPRPELLGAPTGIILLGGGVDPQLSAARGDVELSDAGGRMTAAAILLVRYPQARLVFTGGSASLLRGEPSEAAVADKFFRALGVSPERVTLEDRSRDTFENARFTKAMVMPHAGERWLLVTSAWHMPRAVGVFRSEGFDVSPYPVDYSTRPAFSAVDLFAAGGMRRSERALHEYLGLLVYRLTGRSRELLPGPA